MKKIYVNIALFIIFSLILVLLFYFCIKKRLPIFFTVLGIIMLAVFTYIADVIGY